MYKSTEIYDDKPHEECGVFGIFDHDLSAVHEVYYGIFALQHRGQESAGITVTDGKEMETFRGMGLVTEVFRNLPEKEGHIGIGHVRYSTTGSSIPANVQPLQADSIDGPMALAHNGNLVNTLNLRRRLLLEGSTFSTSMDTEVIIKLLARSRRPTEEEKFKELMDEIHGAYAIVACTNKALYGCRDPFGYRPLVLGKTETGWGQLRRRRRWMPSMPNSSVTSFRVKSFPSMTMASVLPCTARSMLISMASALLNTSILPARTPS